MAYKMKGFSGFKNSPAKNILTIPKGADGGLSKGTGKDKDAHLHNQRHADGLPADHGIKKKKKADGPPFKESSPNKVWGMVAKVGIDILKSDTKALENANNRNISAASIQRR